MRAERISLWQKAVALLPALLLLVCLPGQMMLRCRIDGTLRAACCCPSETDGQGADSVLRAQDCCDREVTQGHHPTAEEAHSPAGDHRGAAVVAWVTTPAPLTTPARARFDRAWRHHGPPREGPRLTVLKQSFLI